MSVNAKIRALIALTVVTVWAVLSCAAYVADPTPRVVVPVLAGITAGAGALLVWNFLELNRRAFIFFVALALLYASVPLIRVCVDSELRTEEFFVSLEAAAASFAPLAFFWFLSSQTRRAWLKIASRAAVYVLTMLLVLFPGSLWAYYIAMHTLLTSDIILALAQTNGDESLEYVQAHADVWWAAAAVLCLALVGIFIALLKGVRAGSCRHFRGRFACGIFLFVVSLYDLVNAIPEIPYMATSVLKVTGRQLQQFELYSKRTHERAARLAQVDGISIQKNFGGIYVLVLGESANRDHLQLYGYERANTPFLKALSAEDSTFYFTRAYSSFPQTVPALTYALTGKNQYNSYDLAESFSIIEIAKKAGFKVIWLSNQRKIGVYETPISVISSAADEEIWLNNTAKMYSLFYDADLLTHFPDLGAEENALVVVHLMGSHERYAERTPDDYKIYEGSKDPRIDAYDDSVRYTDQNLQRIYAKLKDHPRFKAMIYVSDHGEDLDTLFDHNPANFTFPMVRIPLLIKVSDSYAADHRQVTRELRRHHESVWSNDLLYELMCGLMGIRGMPQYEPRFDLSSPSYRMTEKNVTTMHGQYPVRQDPRFEKR